ncbi:amidohydrolase [Candidatus Poribacteria bacterium]|nr:amidohydrolase [Candidatus Poribacteria bacterium]
MNNRRNYKTMLINYEIENINSKLVKIRWDFHRIPELSFEEEKTSQKIAGILREIGIDEIQTGVARTGVVGLIRGRNPGKTIAIRADIDALPIQEENDVSYKSQNDGVMHACGHDVHITTALGTAMIINRKKDELYGNVKFIFQPAEEVAGGGKMMVEEGALENPEVDMIMALHVWPGLDEGKIGVRSGPSMASMDKFEITVKGPGGHGALPHLTSDTIVASAQIINILQTVTSRSIEPIQPVVFSVCMINGGDAFNIIPEEVKLTGTARTLDDEVKTKSIKRVKEILNGISKAMNVKCIFNYLDGCPVLINNPEVVEIIEDAAVQVVGSKNVVEVKPTMGGEDFTYFTRKVPGAMFFLGVKNKSSGMTSSVHTATFDVNPGVLTIGTSILTQAIFNCLNMQ